MAPTETETAIQTEAAGGGPAGGAVLVAAPADGDSMAPATGDFADELVAGELLVEEISIDGMCGVY